MEAQAHSSVVSYTTPCLSFLLFAGFKWNFINFKMEGRQAFFMLHLNATSLTLNLLFTSSSSLVLHRSFG